MKNIIVTIVFISLTACVLLTGCQKNEEKNNQSALDSVKQALPDSQAVQASEWQKFKSESEQKIQNNEDSIAVFKEKMKKSGVRIKTKYNKEIASLEKTNHEMKKKLEDYKNDGKSAWADFKAGFNNDMDKLGKAVKDLTSNND
jgi:hypothetical protein